MVNGKDRNCQYCWYVNGAAGLARPILICNRKENESRLWRVVQPWQGCGNFIKRLMPLPPEFDSPEYAEAAVLPLTKGMSTVVDAEDYSMLCGDKWIAVAGNSTFYAVRRRGRKQISIHRLVMNAPEGMVVDHINHNGLDNRKCNLRICTIAQNSCNQRSLAGSSSRYKGVWLNKHDKIFTASIGYNGRKIHLGTFADETEAARAYDAKAREFFGEYAFLNFPENNH